MSVKTWFKHSCNARQGKGMSSLINVMGIDGYGKFWILNEMLLQQNLDRENPSDTLVIHEHTLAKEWGTLCKQLPKSLHTMSTLLGISAQSVSAQSGNIKYTVWHVTLPKSLIYIQSKREKSDNKSKSKKESKSKSKKESKITEIVVVLPEPLQTPEFMKAWEEWRQHRIEIRHKLTPTQEQKSLAALAKWGNERAVAAVNHSVEKGYQGIYEKNDSGPKAQKYGKKQTNLTEIIDSTKKAMEGLE